MLLQFSCENHKSIKEKVVLSMLAGSDTLREESLKQFGNYRILRSAAIYGANGSGKSSLISAIDFAKVLVANSINHQPGQLIYQPFHKLASKETPSVYDFQFITKGIRYAYGFSIKNNIVAEEYLYYFPEGRRTKIFERKDMEITPGSKYKKKFDVSYTVLKENRLFLSCAANYSNLKEIENAFIFFSNELIIYDAHDNNWRDYSIRLMQKNPLMKQIFLSVLSLLNTGIKDVKVKNEKKFLNKSEIPEQIPEEIKNLIISQETDIFEAKVVYDSFETDLFEEESTGIKKLFEIICPMVDILQNGKVLIFDEIETGWHEAVVYKIIELFHSLMPEQFAQLIFTTHDTSLLDGHLFRRDQIWFTELTPERATDLFSLAEIKNVRKEENLSKGYISGRYGGIPLLNDSVIQHIDFLSNEVGVTG